MAEIKDIHSAGDIEKAVAAVEARHERAKETGSVRYPPFGMTGVFGKKGMGKTALAVAWCDKLYSRGVDVYFTAAAGMRFGTPIGREDDDRSLEELYTIAISLSDCLLFIDELQSYISIYGQLRADAQAFTESLASLRKNNVHVLYTAQSSRQASTSIRQNTDVAWWPSPKPRQPGRKRFGSRRRRSTKVPGKHDFCKLLVYELKGNPLSFTDPPDHLFMRNRWNVEIPPQRRWRPPHNDIFEATKLYDTKADMDYMARTRTSRQKIYSFVRAHHEGPNGRAAAAPSEDDLIRMGFKKKTGDRAPAPTLADLTSRGATE